MNTTINKRYKFEKGGKKKSTIVIPKVPTETYTRMYPDSSYAITDLYGGMYDVPVDRYNDGVRLIKLGALKGKDIRKVYPDIDSNITKLADDAYNRRRHNSYEDIRKLRNRAKSTYELIKAMNGE